MENEKTVKEEEEEKGRSWNVLGEFFREYILKTSQVDII